MNEYPKFDMRQYNILKSKPKIVLLEIIGRIQNDRARDSYTRQEIIDLITYVAEENDIVL